MTKIQNLDPQEVTLLLKNPELVILDVRTDEEYEEGILPKALLIPLHELEQRLGDLPQNKNTPLLVYCSHGMRSLRAADYLQSLGYTQLYNINGGLTQYLEER